MERLREGAMEIKQQLLQRPFGHILSLLRGNEVKETPEKEVRSHGVDIHTTSK